MKLSDFTTIEEAQEHSITVDTKQVGSGQARGLFITEMGAGDYSGMTIWAIFSLAAADVNNPLFSLANAILITASDAGSYFGMDVTKSEGVSNRAGITNLVLGGIMTQETADKFISKTLSITKPFKNVTQEEFDAAKADLLLYVDTPEVKTHYGQLGSTQDKHVKSANESIRITAMLGVVNVVDTVVQVYVHTDDFNQSVYAKNERSVGSITVIAGQLTGALTLENKSKSLSRWTQFSGVANVSGDFDLLVKSA